MKHGNSFVVITQFITRSRDKYIQIMRITTLESYISMVPEIQNILIFIKIYTNIFSVFKVSIRSMFPLDILYLMIVSHKIFVFKVM